MANKITTEQLARELEVVEQQLDTEGISSQNRERAGKLKTTPIDQFLKKPTKPAQYMPRSDLQKMVDINILIFLATCNLSFNIVDQPAFKRFVFLREMISDCSN